MLLFVVFMVAVWLRMQVGAIGGTEQPMDLMFINATTRASHFPPQDPWLSGHTVAYYYFGYLIVAMVGRMAGTAPEVSYNLGIATIATLALVGASGIAYNLIRMHEAAVEPGSGDRARLMILRATAIAPLRSLSRRRRCHRARLHPPLLPRPCSWHSGRGARCPRSSWRSAPAWNQLPAPAMTATPTAAAMPQRPPALTLLPWPRRTGRAVAPGAAGLNLSPDLRASFAGFWRIARAPIFGLTAGLMLVIMGNLVGVLQFMSAYGIGSRRFFQWVDVQGLTTGISRHSWYPSDFFGFFNASRIYPLDHNDGRVITEFPMFSFILGDLHPHVMALPFVLLASALRSRCSAARSRSISRSGSSGRLRWSRPASLSAGSRSSTHGTSRRSTFVVVAAAAVSNFVRVRALTLDLLRAGGVVRAAAALARRSCCICRSTSSFTSQANGIGAVVSSQSVTVPGDAAGARASCSGGRSSPSSLPFVFAACSPRASASRCLRVGARIVPSLLVLLGWVLVFAYERRWAAAS